MYIGLTDIKILKRAIDSIRIVKLSKRETPLIINECLGLYRAPAFFTIRS
jgi:hypothetical protein